MPSSIPLAIEPNLLHWKGGKGVYCQDLGLDLAESAPTSREARVIVTGEASFEATRLAVEQRERRKAPSLHPTHVTVFATPDENDLTHELVLKVHGKGSAIRIQRKPKAERLLGLFEDDREANEEAVTVDLGEEFAYVWGHELTDQAILSVLLSLGGHGGELNADKAGTPHAYVRGAL